MRHGAIVLTVLTSSTLVFAGPAEDAEKLAEQGDFIGAAGKYREAYAADPRPDLMCNVGVAYYKAKDFPHAFRFLEQCVASGKSLDPQFMSAVTQVVEALDTKLRGEEYTPIDIAVEPGTATTKVEINGKTDEPLVGNRRTWIPWGHYKLTIHAEGYVDKIIEGDAKSHDPINARTKLEPKPVEDPNKKKGPDIVGPVKTPPPPARSKTGAIAASAVAVGGGLAALGFFVVAKGKASDAGEAMKFEDWQAAADSARNWQHASWVAGGIGGVAAIAAGVLWYKATRPPAVEVAPSASGGATVSLGWRF